jgi:hypothetical protein
MISLYYVYEEGGSPEGGWVMWIHYYTYFVTEETCSTVAHIHSPKSVLASSAEPDDGIFVSSSLKRILHFNTDIEKSREKTRSRIIDYLVGVNLIIR